MKYIVATLLFVILGLVGAWTAPPSPCGTSIAEEERLRDALERIAILDEADGHTLTWETASQMVGIATHALGDKHPSQIFEERDARRRRAECVGKGSPASDPRPRCAETR